MAHYLVGGISEVIGMNETFIKERPLPQQYDWNIGKKWKEILKKALLPLMMRPYF